MAGGQDSLVDICGIRSEDGTYVLLSALGLSALFKLKNGGKFSRYNILRVDGGDGLAAATLHKLVVYEEA